MPTAVIHTPALSADLKNKIYRCIGGEIERRENCNLVRNVSDVDKSALLDLSKQCQVDINLVPEQFTSDTIGLTISDMDSTLISIECIDEIADFAHLKDKVSTITDAAMRGEIDFETSLRRRVALLKNLHSDVLDKVYVERLRLNPGVETLLAGLQKTQIQTALVSGGFTYFTERLQQRLGLNFQLANQLEIVEQRLTGGVIGEVVSARKKAQYLLELCATLNISSQQTIAIGDGANDLEMLKQAGLGVAYRAKSVVQQQADVALNYSGLDAVLDFINVH